MKHVALALAITACGAAQSPAPAAVAGGHHIVLARPVQVGLRYSVRAHVILDSSVRLRPVHPDFPDYFQQGEMELDAHVLVEAVDERGEPTLSEAWVDRFWWTDAEGQLEILPVGTHLHITVLAPPAIGAISSHVGPLPPETAALLSYVFPVQLRTVPEDDIYGTDAPQPIGAQWDVARAQAVNDASLSIRIRPEQLRGTVTLAERTEIDGVSCLHLVANVHAEGFEVVSEHLITDSATMTMVHESWLPIDGRGLRRRRRTYHSAESVQHQDAVQRLASQTSEVLVTYAYENEP